MLRALFKREQQKTAQSSRTSREVKGTTTSPVTSGTTHSSREVGAPFPGMATFEGFRHMLKDLSKRLDAIRENPEEAYLINTEISFRLLGVLEKLAHLTEKNTAVLEKLAVSHPGNIQQDQDESDKKRRAREVLAALERSGSLTYEQLRTELKPPVTYNRITALVSEMIRDGISLKREGRPVEVSLETNVTGSN